MQHTAIIIIKIAVVYCVCLIMLVHACYKALVLRIIRVYNSCNIDLVVAIHYVSRPILDLNSLAENRPIVLSLYISYSHPKQLHMTAGVSNRPRKRWL